MDKFTLLSKEQVWGRKRLEIFKKRGTKSVITDFSNILSGQVSRETIDGSDYTKNTEKRTGIYWTRTRENIHKDRSSLKVWIYTIGKNGSKREMNQAQRDLSIRPVISLSEGKDIPTNGKKPIKKEDGVLEVEYGYYPQTAVSIIQQELLEKLYKKGLITKTGNTYTTCKWHRSLRKYVMFQNDEYLYNERRYVRATVECNYKSDEANKLSNGIAYHEDDNVWIEVEPVKWLVDEKAGVMTTDKLIFAGVPFDDKESLKKNPEGKFDKTYIKKFMDTYLSKEMFQERKIGEQEVSKGKRGNQNSLNFDKVSEEDIIREAIKANVSVFLHGKPGCGKSDRVKQLDPDFIELNLSHLDPELLDGLAGEKNGKAVHIKPPWLEELEAKCEEEADEIHILFLEELTNASPVMQAKAYGIALDKKVAGRWKLPENVRVVAAGNELEDSLAANEMAEPLYDRFAHVNIETNVENWLKWAATPESSYERLKYEREDSTRPKIHPSIYAYISCMGDEVLRTEYDREHPRPHADPRRWKMASDMLYASNNPETLRAIIGEELTKDFIEFCKMPIISMEDVINGNYTEEDIDMDLGRKLVTVASLVRVDSSNMPKVREFVKKLGPEFLRKFEVQWAHGDEERLEQLQEVMMEEQENEQNIREHSKDEAKETAQVGVLAFEKINEEYQGYLSREVEDETKDK